MTRPLEEFEIVRSLLATGANDCQVSRVTGVPRETIRGWRLGHQNQTPRFSNEGRDYQCLDDHNFATLPAKEYAYLLGMYLGDGCLAQHARGVYRLRIVCDSQYPQIMDECRRSIDALMPGQSAYVQQRPSCCVEVSLYSKHWACLLPQHGPGRKHSRPIRLLPWQEDFVEREAESFVRGLIHSDGCRVIANDRGVRSVRYHFSNRSDDIKGLFCEALNRLEIPWTRPSDKDIAIYRKAAVARLDVFIGPKR